jgi:hypothetical protein
MDFVDRVLRLLMALPPAARRRKVGAGDTAGGMKRLCLSLLCALVCLPARSEIVVTDASGTGIRLAAPARRIVSLSPHITELLFAAGAGDRVVGTAEYSDYPPAAKVLPRVGGHSLDLEAVVALKPDLVLGWQSGNPMRQSISRLRCDGPDRASVRGGSHRGYRRRNRAHRQACRHRSRLRPIRWPRLRFANAMQNWLARYSGRPPVNPCSTRYGSNP